MKLFGPAILLLVISWTFCTAGAQEKVKLEKVTQDPFDKMSKKMDELFDRWNETDSPGVAVAVAQDGKVLFQKGYGMANLEYSVPVTPQTVFHIASVSKQFATFSILLLAEQKKLTLDDDVRKYIPELHRFDHKITLRHLAHHTSGLRDQWSLLVMAGWRMDDVITREHILKLVKNQRELNFQPGEKHTYCNTGYTLLAEVVARVSGKSFADFTKTNIFEPLGMKQTLFYDDHEKIVPNRAYSYKLKKGKWAKSVLSYANVGATSLFTTAEDLSKWAANFDRPKVGNKQIIEQMKTQGVLNSGQKISYAMGQVVGKYRGLNSISHGGADAGYRSFLARFPDQKFSVVLLSNDATFNSGQMSNRVADLFLADKLEKKQQATPGKKIDAKILKQYVASYELRAGLDLKITQKNGELYAQATSQRRFKLKADSETRFVFEPARIELRFRMDKAKKEPELTYKQGEFQLKVFPSTKLDARSINLNDYAGFYRSRELATEYRFFVEGDKLQMTHPRHPRMLATLAGQDTFMAPYLGKVEFIRNMQKEVVGFKASTGRVHNLRFDKHAYPYAQE